MKHFIIFLILISFFSCAGDKEKNIEGKNIFSDKTLQKIYTLQDKRDSMGLHIYLKDRNPIYRKYAALSFASVQDKDSVKEISALLSDSDDSVRQAAAYALGQTGDSMAEDRLMESFSKEASSYVKMVILEALGKCGTEKGLKFLSYLKVKSENEIVLKGQVLGLYRFILRKKNSEEGTGKIFKILKESSSGDVRFYAANYLSRISNIDLSGNFDEIKELYKKETENRVKMNLALAVGKCKGEEALDFLLSAAGAGSDYRVRVNSIKAMSTFDYSEIKDILFKLVNEKDYAISVAASEIILNKGVKEDSKKYIGLAKNISDWRTGVNLLAAALKYSEDKKSVSSIIIAFYKKTLNIYEKGGLLSALGEYSMNFDFIEGEVFSEKDKVIRTNGMLALSSIIKNKNFKPEKKIERGKGIHTLKKVFADILKRGISSGDSAIIGISSGILIDKQSGFKGYFDDLDFLSVAIEKCRLPEDLEAWIALKKAIDFFKGESSQEKDKGKNLTLPKLPANPTNWDQVISISPEQKVRIKTSRGDIVIRLDINKAPGSVSNFLRLIEMGFYEKSIFHRVVPNFVIQDGCPRGDGWGGPPFSIRSEFSDLYYEEGSVGMASAGKDTEGSQWFITHSSTPHLDGRYTIFAKVISGMDVVHKIQVGDRILSLTVLK
ncbi:MAG: peptidylprolyl isomerase [Acidobacteriota bacterium]